MMVNRTRTNRIAFHLNDEEQKILDKKVELSGMKSRGAFLRKLILYGLVYDVDYSYLRSYNVELGRISSSLNQIAARVNSTNHINYDKYHACRRSYYHIRNLSDELCREHNLSVIEADEERGRKHIEWQAEKNNSSWKSAIRKDINAAIRASTTYEEFLQILIAKGYEIKGESLEEKGAKYISFRPIDKERFVRGSAKSLGKEYTREPIKERIDSELERNVKIQTKERISKKLIDVNQETFANSPGLKRWAVVENLKNISESYHAAGSMLELEQKLTLISNETTTAKNKLRQIEKWVKTLLEIIKYAEQYQSTLSIYQSYKKAKNPEAFLQKHESEIILHGGAKRMLEQAGINTKNMNVQKLKAELSTLEKQKGELAATYKGLAKNEKELQKQMQKLKEYLRAEKEEKYERKQEKHSL